VTTMSRREIDVDALECDARRAFDKNKALIEAGEKFRGHKARTWEPSKSPSSYEKRGR
jgi:hypothetical protein